jgi:hypothetical protein
MGDAIREQCPEQRRLPDARPGDHDTARTRLQEVTDRYDALRETYVKHIVHAVAPKLPADAGHRHPLRLRALGRRGAQIGRQVGEVPGHHVKPGQVGGEAGQLSEPAEAASADLRVAVPAVGPTAGEGGQRIQESVLGDHPDDAPEAPDRRPRHTLPRGELRRLGIGRGGVHNEFEAAIAY